MGVQKVSKRCFPSRFQQFSQKVFKEGLKRGFKNVSTFRNGF